MKPTVFFKSLFTFCVASLLMVSCNEDIIDPVVDPVSPDAKYVTLPFSVKLSTIQTKVSLDGNNKYQMQDGDVLYFQNTEKDVSGYVTYSTSPSDPSKPWTGYLKYPQSADFDSEIKNAVLTARLVCAGSTLYTYEVDADLNNHGFPTDLLNPDYSGAIAAHLGDAVQQFSCFSTSFTYAQATTAAAHSIALSQESSFIDFLVSFDGYLGEMLTGNTPVTLDISDEPSALSLSGNADIELNTEPDPDVYQAIFAVALPGGTQLSNATFTICEREKGLADVTLTPNNIYHVERHFDMSPQLGDPFWSDGTYGRISHEQGVSVIGIIVFVNNYQDSDVSELAVEARALTEKASGFGHALVMSLKNADNDDNPATGIKWSTNTSTLYTGAITSPRQILETSNVSGYSITNTLIANNNTTNIAALTAHNYRSNTNDDIDGTSGWFLPSIGQWVYSISTRGFGGAAPAEEWLINETYGNWLTKGSLSNLVLVKNNGTATENLLVKSLNDRLQVLYNDFGCTYDSFGMTSGNDFADNYWSSSEYNEGNAIRMNFGSVETRTDTGDNYSSIKTNYLNKTSTSAWKSAFIMKVRPFLAF